jgi:hypothetical protein
MTSAIRIIRHEPVPKCGSYEVRFFDGRPSKYFYWEDIPARRLRPDQADSKRALEEAQDADTIERAPACNCLDLEIAYGICICLALVPIDWKLSRRFEFVPLQESSQFCYLLCCSIFQFGVCLQLSNSELRIIRKCPRVPVARGIFASSVAREQGGADP